MIIKKEDARAGKTGMGVRYVLAAVGLTAASSAQGSYSVVDSDKQPAGIPAFSTMGNLKVV